MLFTKINKVTIIIDMQKQGIIEMAKAAATAAQKEAVKNRLSEFKYASPKTVNKVNRLLKGAK
jgi:hypothetical protein